jgi:6-phosphogluconolactonase
VSARAEVIVHRDAALLAKAAAARLITKLLDAQAARGSASVVLTGGGIGGATLRAVRESPLIDVVDWSQVDIFWGDERFVDRGSDERNERAAYDALLDHIDLDPARVFPTTTMLRQRRGDMPEPSPHVPPRGHWSPASTCSCSGSARRVTSRRSSPSPQRRSTSAWSSQCTSARSRHPRASR